MDKVFQRLIYCRPGAMSRANHFGTNHMSVLANPRHELFAQQLARGVHPRLAYRRAGYLGDVGGNALARDPGIVARVNELLEAAADETIMDAREVLQRLSVMARGDIRDVFDLEAVKRDRMTGDPIIDPSTGEPVPDVVVLHPKDLSNQAAAIVVEYGFDAQGRTKVKTIDPTKPLEMIGRAHGLWKDNVSLTGADGGPVQTINSQMTPEQAAQFYQMTLGK